MDESIQKHLETALPKVGRFQYFADAMLRGCALTPPLKGQMMIEIAGVQYACALGAAVVGGCSGEDIFEARFAYLNRYHVTIEAENDSGRLTREQIAARIAAL